MPEPALLRHSQGSRLPRRRYYTACRTILDCCKAISGRTTTSRRTSRNSSISWISGPPILMDRSIGSRRPSTADRAARVQLRWGRAQAELKAFITHILTRTGRSPLQARVSLPHRDDLNDLTETERCPLWVISGERRGRGGCLGRPNSLRRIDLQGLSSASRATSSASEKPELNATGQVNDPARSEVR